MRALIIVTALALSLGLRAQSEEERDPGVYLRALRQWDLGGHCAETVYVADIGERLRDATLRRERVDRWLKKHCNGRTSFSHVATLNGGALFVYALSDDGATLLYVNLFFGAEGSVVIVEIERVQRGPGSGRRGVGRGFWRQGPRENSE